MTYMSCTIPKKDEAKLFLFFVQKMSQTGLSVSAKAQRMTSYHLGLVVLLGAQIMLFCIYSTETPVDNV